MRISLMTHGTRGDVQPLIVLAAELKQRGHDIQMAVPVNTTEMVRRIGLPVHSLPMDSQCFLESEEVKAALAADRTRDFMRLLRTASRAHGAETTQALHNACAGADVIVAGPMMEDLATVMAEAQRVPLALLHTFPMRGTAAVANPMVSGRSFKVPGVNQLTHQLYERLSWRARAEGINRLRATLGLAPTKWSTPRRARMLGAIELQAYSANVVRDLRQPSYRPMIGWLQLTEEQRRLMGEYGLQPDLEEWIARGDAPVYFGFGSMPVVDPTKVISLIGQVTSALRLRAIVSAGWANLKATDVVDPARVRFVNSIDHEALLPRCRLVVHHGGSGTTGASVRAGLATMVCSVLLDQRLWGQRLEELGIAAHIRFPKLTATTLQAGLERLLDPKVMARAHALGAAVRAEPDASKTAADLVTGI